MCIQFHVIWISIYVWQLVSAAFSLAHFLFFFANSEAWKKAMEKDRPRSSSRDKAARLEKGHGKGGLEKGHDKGGLEKGKQIRGGANRKPSLDMKEEELSQVFDLIMKRKGARAFDFGVYNTLDVAQAASAKGLVECQNLAQRHLATSDLQGSWFVEAKVRQ